MLKCLPVANIIENPRKIGTGKIPHFSPFSFCLFFCLDTKEPKNIRIVDDFFICAHERVQGCIKMAKK